GAALVDGAVAVVVVARAAVLGATGVDVPVVVVALPAYRVPPVLVRVFQQPDAEVVEARLRAMVDEEAAIASRHRSGVAAGQDLRPVEENRDLATPVLDPQVVDSRADGIRQRPPGDGLVAPTVTAKDANEVGVGVGVPV